MRIAFCNQDPYWGGLANNGGSLSVVAMVKALKMLGHKAWIVTNSDKLTWVTHDPPRQSIPKKVDVCVAVSASAVMPMLKAISCKIPAVWWMRGLETWQVPANTIVKYAKKVNRMLVNSEGLQEWLISRNVASDVAYQGVDVGNWHNSMVAQPKTVGFYVSNRATKRFNDVKRITKAVVKHGWACRGYGPKGQVGIGVKHFAKKYFDKLLVSPSHNELHTLYNSCQVWVCTSELEGLHNVGMEASLCGCYLVCNGHPLAGTMDYAIDGKSACVYKPNNPEDAVEIIQKLPSSDMASMRWVCENIIRNRIGDRQMAAMRFVEALQ